MKAPKNFYNTVDQKKLGVDELFTRTAENEADIIALENAMADIEAKEALKSVKYFRVVMDRTSGDSFHVNGFRLHSSSMNEDFTFPAGSTVSASITIQNIQLLIQNETREVGVWHVDNLYPFNIDFYVPTGVDLTVYNEVQFLGGFYEATFPQSAKLLISDDGTTYKEVKSNDSITYPGADTRVDFFGFGADPVIEDIYDKIDDLETAVGDSTSGLIKDVSDLQDDSEHYHDDIADLKTADVALGVRIDKVIEDTSLVEYYVDFIGTTGMVLLNGKTCKDICDDVVAGKRVVICTYTNDASTGIKKIYYGQTLERYTNNTVSSSHPVSCTFSGLVYETNAIKYYSLYVNYTASVPDSNSILIFSKTITAT